MYIRVKNCSCARVEDKNLFNRVSYCIFRNFLYWKSIAQYSCGIQKENSEINLLLGGTAVKLRNSLEVMLIHKGHSIYFPVNFQYSVSYLCSNCNISWEYYSSEVYQVFRPLPAAFLENDPLQ